MLDVRTNVRVFMSARSRMEAGDNGVRSQELHVHVCSDLNNNAVNADREQTSAGSTGSANSARSATASTSTSARTGSTAEWCSAAKSSADSCSC